MSNVSFRPVLAPFANNLKISPLVLGIVIFLLSLVAERAALQEYARNRINAVSDAVSVSRDFQGLLLDSTGTASLMLNVMERQGLFYVQSLAVNPLARPSQLFRSEFAPNGKNGFRNTWPTRFLIVRQGLDPEVSATLILSSQTFLTIILFSSACGLFAAFLLIHFRRWKEQEAKTLASMKVELLATQVAHDIRSPLAALAAAEGDLMALPEETRVLIRSAVARIRDIANELLTKNLVDMASQITEDASKEGVSPQLLSSLIDGIMTEKRMQFRSHLRVEIESSLESNCYGLFANIQANNFKRVLSNLINNAVEAMPSGGRVDVRLASSLTGVKVIVIDNGTGIPPEVLLKLTHRGETYGKLGGSGLGLFHARTCCEAWGGALLIKSSAGHGTVITLDLPRCPSPAWFTERLNLSPGMTVVMLDDDPSIHRVWHGRWESLLAKERGIHFEYFSTSNQLREWRAKNHLGARPVLCLVDYELVGLTESGLDLIQELELNKDTVLVTSRYEDNSIRDRCLQLGVQLLPKGMAGFVPINFLQPKV